MNNISYCSTIGPLSLIQLLDPSMWSFSDPVVKLRAYNSSIFFSWSLAPNSCNQTQQKC